MLITNDDERRAFYEGCSVAPDQLLQVWTMRLANGERGPKAEGIALRILHDFSFREMMGIPQSPFTLTWLSDCFSRITDDFEDARSVFGLPKRPNHRPPDAMRAINVAFWVELVELRGFSRADAIQMAAECFGCDDSSIRRFVRQAKSWAKGIIPEARWELFFDGRPGHPHLPAAAEPTRKKSRLPASR